MALLTTRPLPDLLLFAIACADGGGADPWVIWKDGVYYSFKSSNNRIWISRSPTLTDVYRGRRTQQRTRFHSNSTSHRVRGAAVRQRGA